MENPTDRLVGGDQLPSAPERAAHVEDEATAGQLARRESGDTGLASEPPGSASLPDQTGASGADATTGQGSGDLGGGVGPPIRGESGERLANARILLVYAADEIESERRPDPYELAVTVSAAVEALIALCDKSRRLRIDPPEVEELRAWALRLHDHATKPRPKGLPRWWPGRPSGAPAPAGGKRHGGRAR
jgi:hypothetical protein